MNVESENGQYNVYISDTFNGIYDVIMQYNFKGKIFLFTDDIVYDLYSNIIRDLKDNIGCNVFFFNHGEQNKSIETVEKIYDFLFEKGAGRDSVVIALGGGLVGDIVGFAASTYMRGIKFVNIPTTMLSQIDSCIGGKVGCNYNEVKNMIGNFFNPEFVYVCTDFLNTLNDGLFRDGLGELVKYGIIDSREFFNYINDNCEKILQRNKDTILHIIERCLCIKKDVVAKDFRDTGLRNILNFGHTVGHAVEICSDFSIYHGEAVSLGMLTALKLSQDRFHIEHSIYNSVLELLKRFNLPVAYKIHDYNVFLDTIKHDKKNDSSIRFVLISDIGKCNIKIKVEEDELKEAIGQSIDI